MSNFTSTSLPRPALDVATRTINQEAIQYRLDTGKLRGHLLPERPAVAELLGLNTVNDLLCPLDEAIQLVI